LKVLLVNLLAALNFANVFKNKKRLENKKTLKNVKKRDKNKKKTSMPHRTTEAIYTSAGRNQ